MKNKSLPSKTLSVYLLALICFGVQGIAQETKVKSDSLKIEVKQVEAQKAIVIKVTVATREIGQKMGEVYGKLFSYSGANNITPAGPPFSVYYEFDPNGNTTFEAGFPVSQVVKSEGDVVYKEYPAMKVVSTLYVGPYEKMMEPYTALDKYIKDNKLETIKTSWEVYLTNPMEVKPEENKTIIYFPIK
jgi:effector-binding domain-containing protein